MPATLSKSKLRQDSLARRSAIAEADRSRWSAGIGGRLIEVLPAAHVVAGYCPIRGEADVMYALSQLAKTRIIALPRVEAAGKPLVFHRWKPGDALVKSAYGVDEPRGEIVMPHIVIVPLLAFDRRGHRLGYGRGYYDITLAALRSVNPQLLAIGAAFSLQEVPDFSEDEHDQVLDLIVTEKEILDVRLKV